MLNPKFNWREARSLLTDPDTQGLVLMTIVLSIVGDSLFGNPEEGIEEMESNELYAEVFEATNSWMSEEGECKLQALKNAMQGDVFYTNSTMFLSVSNALLDGDLGDLINGVFEVPSAVECMWAIMEVELARDEEEGPPEFSRHVNGVLQEILAKEQEDFSEFAEEIAAEYHDMLSRLKRLGLSHDEIARLDAEYAETLQALEEDVEESKGM